MVTRILVIDSDPAIRAAFERFFGGMAVELVTAESMAEPFTAMPPTPDSLIDARMCCSTGEPIST